MLKEEDPAEMPGKEYLAQLGETLDQVNKKLLSNRERQRVLRECIKWERTYVSPDLLLPWFEDSYQNSPCLNVCDKKPVFHQLKKFSREEVQHLKSGIAGLWALQRLSKGESIVSAASQNVKQETEMPWDEVAQILPDRTTTEVKLKWLNELDPRLRLKHQWTTDELSKLESAVKKHNQREWIKVAKEVTRRTPLQCYQKWQERHRKELLNVEWSIEEDEKMRDLVYKHGEKEWKLIASEMPKRSPEQLLHRWTRTSNPNIVHGRWAPEDDFKLIVMMRYLTGNAPIDKKDKTQIWCTAASIFPHKTDRKIRERWCNVIDCEKKEFTPAIDKRIMSLVKDRFNGTCRGSEISKILKTGHTGAQINRRYKKLNKARQRLSNINSGFRIKKNRPTSTARSAPTAATSSLDNEPPFIQPAGSFNNLFKNNDTIYTPEVIVNDLTESDYGDSDDEYVPPSVMRQETGYLLRKRPRASRKRKQTRQFSVKTEGGEPRGKRVRTEFNTTPQQQARVKPKKVVPAPKERSTPPRPKIILGKGSFPVSPEITSDSTRANNIVQPSHITPATMA